MFKLSVFLENQAFGPQNFELLNSVLQFELRVDPTFTDFFNLRLDTSS